MLESIDLTQEISKAEYKSATSGLLLRLGAFQRRLWERHIPVLILFEGWDAAGKGTVMNRLIRAFDPRGFTVHAATRPSEDELLRPFFWRYWNRTPPAGRIGLYDHGWYRLVLEDRLERDGNEGELADGYRDILCFERQLADGGALIIKFFLHIDKHEQKRRFKKLQSKKETSWRVTKEDWKHHKKYEDLLAAYEDMLQKTDTSWAPWTIVEAHDERFAAVKVLKTVSRAFERRLDEVSPCATGRSSDVSHAPNSAGDPQNDLPATPTESSPDTATQPAAASDPSTLEGFDAVDPREANEPKPGAVDTRTSILSTVDLSATLDRSSYEEQLNDLQKNLRRLQFDAYRHRLAAVIVYEGWDAAGKGGNIRRLTSNLDPRGYEVIPIGAPNDVERAHHYLWRFWQRMPKAGHMAVFDRSWYGRVMVERVERLCSPEEWRRAYREINEMEDQLVRNGVVVVKFFLHLDPDEQLRRFREREETPYKRWKITPEDWRNREKWPEYEAAIDEMLVRTSTRVAPWTVIPANSKLHARITALETVVAALEARL